jgi:YD repeat-containing protein
VRTTQLIDENGQSHLWGYDTATPANVHNRIRSQDPKGRITAYTFDANGNITQATNPSGSTGTYANFTTFNHPGKVKDPNGNYAVMKYDARGNLTQEIRLRRRYCQAVNCATLDPASYTPAATDMIAWRVMGSTAWWWQRVRPTPRMPRSGLMPGATGSHQREHCPPEFDTSAQIWRLTSI